jgi:hypothetical protein
MVQVAFKYDNLIDFIHSGAWKFLNEDCGHNSPGTLVLCNIYLRRKKYK